MMNLFSTFNPVTNTNYSLNWAMIMIPLAPMINLYWNTKSPSHSLNNLLNMNITKQMKPSMNKLDAPNITMIMMIMLIIMFYNITSLLPSTFSLTAHIAANMSLSLTLWMATMLKKSMTPMDMMSHLTPPNTPALLVPFMVMIELTSLLIQPLTLSIRLTANIMAGHIMMILISNLHALSPLSAMTMNTMMMILELGVSIIQAYVFSMLICMYLK